MSAESKKLYPNKKRDKNPDTPAFVGKYYLTNKELLPAVIEAKSKGKMTEELGKMLLTLTTNFAKRPNFSGYTYKQDMISEALINLCQNALKFNPEKSNNPFAFYTTCINNSFIQFLNNEKKHRRIRDQLLIEIGENPSYNFSDEYSNHVKDGSELKDDLTDLKSQIEEAKERESKEVSRDLEKDLKNNESSEDQTLLNF